MPFSMHAMRMSVDDIVSYGCTSPSNTMWNKHENAIHEDRILV